MRVMLIVWLGFIVMAYTQDTAKVDFLAEGSEAPVFSLPDEQNSYFFLRDFCGPELRKPWINKEKQVVVLSFFATWCLPCEIEIPYLMQLNEHYEEQPVKFFLINVAEERQKVLSYVKRKQFTLPVLFDQYKIVSDRYGALTLPRLVVIDREGLVRRYQKGFEDAQLFMTEMTGLLDNLLQE